jgi:hypothetical protein
MSEVVTLSPLLAATLVSAIAAVMTEVHTVARRGVNTFHGYRFARMGDVLQEITPLLGKHGIVIFQSETGRAMFDDGNVVAVEFAFTVVHASGETWPHALRQTGVSTCRNSKGGWDDKSLNKCHTAARKYFLLALFQIPTGEEDDADRGENERRALPAISHYAPPPYAGEGTTTRGAKVPDRIQRNLDRLQPKPGSIADRAMVARAHRSWAKPPGPSQPFRASQAGKYDERNPPPDDVIPDHAAAALNRRLHPLDDELPGDLGRPNVDTTDRGGVPAFLDRRKANGSADDAAEATFVDLVTGGDR